VRSGLVSLPSIARLSRSVLGTRGFATLPYGRYAFSEKGPPSNNNDLYEYLNKPSNNLHSYREARFIWGIPNFTLWQTACQRGGHINVWRLWEGRGPPTG